MTTSPHIPSTAQPAGTRVARWGEGPIFHNGLLYYTDIEGRAILAHEPLAGSEHQWSVEGRPGFVVPRLSGGLLWGGDGGLHFLDPETGVSTPICHPEPDLPNNRFNDGKCSPDGRLFAGTIALDKTPGNAALYRLDPDLTLTRVLEGLTNSNGIGWSPDGATCYHIDTPTREVSAFDYNPADGSLSRRRTAFSTAAIDASPDGLAIDREGAIWIAFCHGACVVRFSPNGRELARLDLPCLETTAVAFGGPDLQDLFITTGIHATVAENLAGRLFIAPGQPVPGLPATPFRG